MDFRFNEKRSESQKFTIPEPQGAGHNTAVIPAKAKISVDQAIGDKRIVRPWPLLSEKPVLLTECEG
jgi:hypothetical protein